MLMYNTDVALASDLYGTSQLLNIKTQLQNRQFYAIIQL